jgi:hypothetical protein
LNKPSVVRFQKQKSSHKSLGRAVFVSQKAVGYPGLFDDSMQPKMNKAFTAEVHKKMNCFLKKTKTLTLKNCFARKKINFYSLEP